MQHPHLILSERQEASGDCYTGAVREGESGTQQVRLLRGREGGERGERGEGREGGGGTEQSL